ncbi:MAG: hypothetical protein C7B44_15660 [Sulfobacillus thermosulfidooxidans]|uniref:Uncharacterized protein n=1 Tax=Sulfobacillus thermosulfidooxidans TaxID=28034 RepID=A0A2T2WK13_SULTH|nr:MAG: hypothetical protein C7B47_16555 [Sulfobacillus thermosulfidooxidans]PSR32041.1 MAG: hypothetical protein C7B44_15660 [Sulfobacillus thermosulfidooxidans]
MESHVTSKVYHVIQEISAPGGIRSITPGFVARMLQLDPQTVFEAMVKLTDLGFLGQQLHIMCPFCANALDDQRLDLGKTITCAVCGKTFVVSTENIYMRFSYVPEKNISYTPGNVDGTSPIQESIASSLPMPNFKTTIARYAPRIDRSRSETP